MLNFSLIICVPSYFVNTPCLPGEVGAVWGPCGGTLTPILIPVSTEFLSCKCLLTAFSLFLAFNVRAFQVYGYISNRMKSSLFIFPTNPVSDIHFTVVRYSGHRAIKSSSPIMLPISNRNSYITQLKQSCLHILEYVCYVRHS